MRDSGKQHLPYLGKNAFIIKIFSKVHQKCINRRRTFLVHSMSFNPIKDNNDYNIYIVNIYKLCLALIYFYF